MKGRVVPGMLRIMSLPDTLRGLLSPEAYPHPCAGVELVETHISWVLLTGKYAYKLKKPVRFSFVDFSTLERRAHFCREELRCNRRFAPELYLDVVPVSAAGDALRVGGAGPVLEWAVKMRQFPAEAQLDRLLERDGLGTGQLAAFGRTLAGQHAALPSRRLAAADLEPRVLAPVRDNFRDMAGLSWLAGHAAQLEDVRQATEAQAAQHRRALVERLEQGWTRECHGDLHLSNLVLLGDQVRAFDCLEFNPDLRWIDPQSDVAFLLMDCLVRGAGDAGYAFVDGYLDCSGDYAGAVLLPFYAAYRSMVRAKVAALRRDQAPAADRAADERRCLAHLDWTRRWLSRPAGVLVLMCGVSGSGKSFLAERLVPRLPALRLRSDVARKRLAGLAPDAAAAAGVGGGIYTAQGSVAVYRWLETLAGSLLRAGENVIVDATFLDPVQRRRFLALAAGAAAPVRVVFCDAPRDVLAARVRRRAAAGTDVSDADVAVLRHQLENLEVPSGAIRFDTAAAPGEKRLNALAQKLLER